MTELLPRTYWCHRGYQGPVRVRIAPTGTTAPYPGLALDWMRESVRAALPGLGRESFGTAWAWLGDHRAVAVAVHELRCGRPYAFTLPTEVGCWTWTVRVVTVLPLGDPCFASITPSLLAT
ncbi:hypothetical protein [Streptomyces niveus]|uniref:hypothetical protein n=1 Tax=Streptomyces niveus TaxID=193462 RepID=UPI003423336E